VQSAVQACLEAQQQRHHHRQGSGQQPAFRHRQAAQQEGQQHRHLGGQAVIGIGAGLDQVAGDDQQGQYHEHGDPGHGTEVVGTEHRQPTEQAAEAEGAHAGQLLRVAVSFAPAAFGTDQQAHAKRRGQIQEQFQGHGRQPAVQNKDQSIRSTTQRTCAEANPLRFSSAAGVDSSSRAGRRA